MKAKLVDATLPYSPVTGLRAMFWSVSGAPVWPHCGSDGEVDDDDPEDSEEDSEDEGEEDKDVDSEDNDKSKKDAKKSSRVSREEYDELRKKYEARTKHLSESDKKKSAAEKELAELKKKDLPEIEKAKKDFEEASKDRDSYKDKFMKLARTNAFLTASVQEDILWEDPTDAMAISGKDLHELEISEDGSVEGIRELVKGLSKRKPHLLKSKKDEEEEDKEDKSKNRRNGATGSGVGSRNNGGRGKKKGELSAEELRRKFPSLRR